MNYYADAKTDVLLNIFARARAWSAARPPACEPEQRSKAQHIAVATCCAGRVPTPLSATAMK